MPISGEPPTQNGMVHVDALRGGNYRAFFCMVVFWGCVRGRVVIFRDPILEHRGAPGTVCVRAAAVPAATHSAGAGANPMPISGDPPTQNGMVHVDAHCDTGDDYLGSRFDRLSLLRC